MKAILLITCFLTGSTALAATFQGAVKYTKEYCAGPHCGSKPRFDHLEQLGVERAAELDALSECASAGFAKCYTTSVRITSCNGTEYSGGFLKVTCAANAISNGE